MGALALRVRVRSSAVVGPPVVVFDRDGVRAVDRAAVEEFGIPGVALMENASAALAAECFDALRSVDDPFALILCGPGNNGGDGHACARRLLNGGVRVAVVSMDDPRDARSDAGVNAHALRAMRRPGAEIRSIHGHGKEDARRALDALAQSLGEPALLVDAMLGTGLDRALGEPYASAVRWVNERRARTGAAVVAADIPTGLDANTGEALGGLAVRAKVTVTFAGVKEGFLKPGAREYLGEVVVGDIGAPRELLTRFGRAAREGEVAPR
jgi:NAD(P)H-hydrate epimerase